MSSNPQSDLMSRLLVLGSVFLSFSFFFLPSTAVDWLSSHHCPTDIRYNILYSMREVTY